MELSENLSRSWEFTKRLTEDIGNLILLIVLSIIPIINIVVIGYGARITRLGDSIDKPPKISDYLDTFIDGVMVIIVIIIYSIIPMLIFALFLGLALISKYPIEALMRPGGLMALLPAGIKIIGMGIALIVGFIIFIFGAMGIIDMIKTKSFGAAFNFSNILKLIRSVGWGKYISWLIVMYILAIIAGSLSSLHWVLSIVIGVFFMVFLARSAHYIYPVEEAAEQPEIEGA